MLNSQISWERLEKASNSNFYCCALLFKIFAIDGYLVFICYLMKYICYTLSSTTYNSVSCVTVLRV